MSTAGKFSSNEEALQHWWANASEKDKTDAKKAVETNGASQRTSFKILGDDGKYRSKQLRLGAGPPRKDKVPPSRTDHGMFNKFFGVGASHDSLDRNSGGAGQAGGATTKGTAQPSGSASGPKAAAASAKPTKVSPKAAGAASSKTAAASANAAAGASPKAAGAASSKTAAAPSKPRAPPARASPGPKKNNRGKKKKKSTVDSDVDSDEEQQTTTTPTTTATSNNILFTDDDDEAVAAPSDSEPEPSSPSALDRTKLLLPVGGGVEHVQGYRLPFQKTAILYGRHLRAKDHGVQHITAPTIGDDLTIAGVHQSPVLGGGVHQFLVSLVEKAAGPADNRLQSRLQIVGMNFIAEDKLGKDAVKNRQEFTDKHRTENAAILSRVLGVDVDPGDRDAGIFCPTIEVLECGDREAVGGYGGKKTRKEIDLEKAERFADEVGKTIFASRCRE